MLHATVTICIQQLNCTAAVTVTIACVARGINSLLLFVRTLFCLAETDQDDTLPQEASLTASNEAISASSSTEPVADPLSTETVANQPSTEQIVDSEAMNDDGDSLSKFNDNAPDSLPRVDGPSACDCLCCVCSAK